MSSAWPKRRKKCIEYWICVLCSTWHGQYRNRAHKCLSSRQWRRREWDNLIDRCIVNIAILSVFLVGMAQQNSAVFTIEPNASVIRLHGSDIKSILFRGVLWFIAMFIGHINLLHFVCILYVRERERRFYAPRSTKIVLTAHRGLYWFCCLCQFLRCANRTPGQTSRLSQVRFIVLRGCQTTKLIRCRTCIRLPHLRHFDRWNFLM